MPCLLCSRRKAQSHPTAMRKTHERKNRYLINPILSHYYLWTDPKIHVKQLFFVVFKICKHWQLVRLCVHRKLFPIERSCPEYLINLYYIYENAPCVFNKDNNARRQARGWVGSCRLAGSDNVETPADLQTLQWISVNIY